MKTKTVETLPQFWEWLQKYITEKFVFLVYENNFTLGEIKVMQNQLVIEYNSNGSEIGFWCSLGTRPEIYFKRESKRIFTDELKKIAGVSEPSPIKSAVFGQRLDRKDYVGIFNYYEQILKMYISEHDD